MSECVNAYVTNGSMHMEGRGYLEGISFFLLQHGLQELNTCPKLDLHVFNCRGISKVSSHNIFLSIQHIVVKDNYNYIHLFLNLFLE